MALEAAEGRIAEAEELLAKTLAASAAWQELCGADDEVQALARVHFNSLPESLEEEDAWQNYEQLLPLALVTTGQNGLALRRAGVGVYAPGGTLGLTLEAKIPEAEASNDAERARWWLNRIGRIAWDLLGKDSEAGFLTVESLNLENWEFGPPENETVQGFVLARAMMVVTHGVVGD